MLMAVDHLDDYSSEWAPVTSVSLTLCMTRETLRVGVRRAQSDGGIRPGLTTDERKRLKELEKEVRDLRRAVSLYPPPNLVGFGGDQFGLSASRARRA